MRPHTSAVAEPGADCVGRSRLLIEAIPNKKSLEKPCGDWQRGWEKWFSTSRKLDFANRMAGQRLIHGNTKRLERAA